MSTGVNYFDELVQRRHGGSMDDQVAEDSCANETLFGGGLAFKVDASVICTGCIGVKANTLQVFDGGEGRHQGSEQAPRTRARMGLCPVRLRVT